MMFSHSNLRSRLLGFLLLALVLTMVAVTAVTADSGAQTVVGVELLGQVDYETGFRFGDTEVGGLSAITYDARRGVYYALSDDRSDIDLARYYTVAIDLGDGSLDDGDVRFVRVTTLLDRRRRPYAPRAVDPEGIDLVRPGQLYISSEGSTNAEPPLNPFVERFNPRGKQNRALPLPAKFLPNAERTVGVRNNLAFESLVSSPNRRFLYTATENALLQDGPASGLGVESLSRVLQLNLRRGRPAAEWVYVVGAIPVPPDPPDAFADNGLVELRTLDNHGTFLAMERSFAVGVGNTIKIFEISAAGATNVADIDDLFDEVTGEIAPFVPMSKRLVVDLADLGLDPDNVEGMTFGPRLADGRRTLILVSDNNFNPDQITQFIALAVELESR